MHSEVARNGPAGERMVGSEVWSVCAVILSYLPLALYRLVCAFGTRVVTVLTRVDCPGHLLLADEKHSPLSDRQSVPAHHCQWPCIGHLGDTERPVRQSLLSPLRSSNARWSTRADLSGPGDSDRMVRQHHQEHAQLFLVRVLATVSARDQQAPKKRVAIASPLRKALRSTVYTVLHRARRGRLTGVCARPAVTPLRRTTAPTTAGTANGEARTTMVPGQESGLVAVGSQTPGCQRTSTLLDQAHTAIDRKLFMMKGFLIQMGANRRCSRDSHTCTTWYPLPASASTLAMCVEVEGGKVPHATGCQSPNPHFGRLR